MVDRSKCPCGSANDYSKCCRDFHQGLKKPDTAEQLMRSRYSAYVKKMKNYLLDTWHSSTRPKAEELELDEESGFRWLNLKVISSERGKIEDDIGLVSFIASFKFGNQKGEMKEASKFIKEEGIWYYVDGV